MFLKSYPLSLYHVKQFNIFTFMTIYELSISEKIYKGKLINHQPRSIFDSGYVFGELYLPDYNGVTTLKNDFRKFEVISDTVKLVYEEFYIFKESKNPFLVLREISKHDSINELILLEFKNEKEMKTYISNFKKRKSKYDDNKWSETLHFKNLDSIKIEIDA